MNSISRAVSSKFSELSNKRQRLVGEKKSNEDEFVNPSWSELDPTTSDFNCIEPSPLAIPEEAWKDLTIETNIAQSVAPTKSISPKSPSHIIIPKKVTSVVRKLSPFSMTGNHTNNNNNNNNTVSIDQNNSNYVLTTEGSTKATESSEEESKNRKFKDTRGKMDKIKKSFRAKDQEQLIESDQE